MTKAECEDKYERLQMLTEHLYMTLKGCHRCWESSAEIHPVDAALNAFEEHFKDSYVWGTAVRLDSSVKSEEK